MTCNNHMVVTKLSLCTHKLKILRLMRWLQKCNGIVIIIYILTSCRHWDEFIDEKEIQYHLCHLLSTSFHVWNSRHLLVILPLPLPLPLIIVILITCKNTMHRPSLLLAYVNKICLEKSDNKKYHGRKLGSMQPPSLLFYLWWWKLIMCWPLFKWDCNIDL